MILTPEIERVLSLVDQAIEHRYLRVEKIRLLAGNEENYHTIIREVDRVKAQLLYARREHAVATLTMREWFTILDRFAWKCAYCGEKPFQVMSHVIARSEGGTTAENCVPACHHCVSSPKKKLRSPQKDILTPEKTELP
jgi:5-methylcytosine-specific restriction endonuclease McrA